MGIQNFPAALQPIIQQGFLEREFKQALRSRLGYRQAARREEFAVGLGETVTKTRAGLLASVTTPLAPNTNTNLDNGLTANTWTVEQYSLTINHYAATQDLNMVTTRVGIASQFLQNAYTNGEQAARSLDELARNALFNSYFGGNTRVRLTLGAPAATISVDDVRGFLFVPILTGAGFTSASQALAAGQPSPTMAPVSATNTLSVVVGSNSYTLTGASVDGSNVSTTPGGKSGTLTFSSNVAVADGTLGNAVVAANASVILRPSGRPSTYQLATSDTLTMSSLLDAVAVMHSNAIPPIDGAYNCHLDPVSARQLFADPDFKELFRGATSSNDVFRSGMVNDFLGLRFLRTTEAYVQPHPTIAGLYVRRPIIAGADALVEGDFAGMASADIAPKDSIISMVDGIAMVTREPLDRLQQIIAQSWYWMGGFTCPSDTVTSPTTVPTANNASYKRAVMIEHVG